MARAGRKRKMVIHPMEGPTPEQREKAEYELVNVALIDPAEQPIGYALRNRTPTVLARLFRQGHIDERQYTAGTLFRENWERAGLDKRVTASYELPTGAPQCTYGMPATEFQAHYRGLHRDAMEVFLGTVYGKRAIDVICLDRAPVTIGNGSRPALTGMATIRMILDLLAGHYKIYPRDY